MITILRRIVIAGFITMTFMALAWNGEWTGFYFPKGDTLNEQRGGPFRTQKECFRWVHRQTRTSEDTYECGLNCKFSRSTGLTTCQEIVY